MSDSRHDIGKPRDLVAGRHFGAVDHYHRQPQLAGRIKLGARPTATGILAKKQVDAVLAHHVQVSSNGKRTAIDDHVMMRQQRRIHGRIHQAQNVVVLGLRGESQQILTPDGQKDAPRGTFKRNQGSIKIRDPRPAVTRAGPPWRAGEDGQRHASHARGGDRVGADGCSKGMGGVDQMGNALPAEIRGQPGGTAKATDTHRQRLRAWPGHPPGIAEHCRNAGIRECLRQRAGLGGAAKNKDVGHG